MMIYAKTKAWAVHLYTATGLILAALIAITINSGTKDSFHSAFLLMIIATIIDATDGTLARKFHVKTVLPNFDGRRLDDIVDFHTYTSLPLFLLWRADIFPSNLAWLLVLPLLASAYGFCQSNIKTADGFFLGFPSYWNVVAFYLYFLSPGVSISSMVIILFSILTFVPIKYFYPSQPSAYRKQMIVLSSLWAVLLFCSLFIRQEGLQTTLVLISAIFPAYYLSLSWWLDYRSRRSATLH